MSEIAELPFGGRWEQRSCGWVGQEGVNDGAVVAGDRLLLPCPGSQRSPWYLFLWFGPDIYFFFSVRRLSGSFLCYLLPAEYLCNKALLVIAQLPLCKSASAGDPGVARLPLCLNAGGGVLHSCPWAIVLRCRRRVVARPLCRGTSTPLCAAVPFSASAPLAWLPLG